LGLGIDAGGTFTDAVLIDLATHAVVAKAKAPTTHQELSIGIRQAVGKLPADRFAEVTLASLSTTLATNAIVENRGAHVGLILMPVLAEIVNDIQIHPVRVVPGRMTIDGHENEAVDAEAVRRAVKEMLAEGAESFAVSGYSSVHNPSHEKQVKEIIHAIANVPVVCGHELSGKLDFVRRAHTAVLNARLMPVVADLLHAVEESLRQFGIVAPVFVVRGDGSLIEAASAKARAIETILSGPAASAIGARMLTGHDDIVAVDIGGTTSDVAIIAGGRVNGCSDGATVGPWRTSVSAADILTTGLGGDSYVQVTEGGMKVTVGPQRVIPLSFIGAQHATVGEELRTLANDADFDRIMPMCVEFFELVGVRPGIRLSASEERLVGALADGPKSRQSLADAIGAVSLMLLPTTRLESLGVIRRCAFTPTDALHVLSEFNEFDTGSALAAARVLGRFTKHEAEGFAERVRFEVTRRLAYEILRREVSVHLGDPAAVAHPTFHKLLDTMVMGRVRTNPHYTMHFSTHRPVVGIGAPAGAFLPAAGQWVGATVVIPTHAEVANAVGAISGKVIVRETISICPDEVGSFVMMSPLGRKEFSQLCDAQKEATDHLTSHLRAQAAQFGTDSQQVTIDVVEKTGLLDDGSRQFLALIINGELQGWPRLTASPH